jgi:hypothetical protein
MERQLWQEIIRLLAQSGKPRFSPHEDFSDDDILRVYFWAVVHDRPVSWACQRKNWELTLRKRKLPSNSTMSRRLRSPSVRERALALEKRLLRSTNDGQLVWFLDGKPLAISGCSKDRQAGYGRAAGGKAKGYKIHALVGADASIAAWRLAPMNIDERTMARRMLLVADIRGYVAADSNYDSNDLHAVCEGRGNLQLLTPRRYGPGRGHGHRKQTAGRMRSKAILENPYPDFGEDLMAQRIAIEQRFGNLTNWGGGLTHLPPWARTYRRVYQWVQAKLIVNAVRRLLQQTTYVNE